MSNLPQNNLHDVLKRKAMNQQASLCQSSIPEISAEKKVRVLVQGAKHLRLKI
jgi:hypothetical protein